MRKFLQSVCLWVFPILSFMCCMHAESLRTSISTNAMSHDSALKMLVTKEVLSKKKELVAFADIQKILKSGVLTVALLKDDIFPFFFYDAQEGFLGIDRQLINAIARALGSNIKLKVIRTAKTYDEIIQQVSSGKAHIGISKINYTPERSLKILYSDVPYITLHPALLINKKMISNPNNKFHARDFFSARSKRKICTITKSSNAYVVKKLFPHAKIIAAKNDKVRDRKFVEGHCDALLLDDFDVKQKLAEDPFLKQYYKVVILDKVETPVYVVTNPRYPNLLYFVDDLIRNSTSLQFSLSSSFEQYKKYIKQVRSRKDELAQQKAVKQNNKEQDSTPLNNKTETKGEAVS